MRSAAPQRIGVEKEINSGAPGCRTAIISKCEPLSGRSRRRYCSPAWRGTIVVQTGTVTDSAQLNVLPFDQLVIWGAGKLSTVNTDGSESTLLTTSQDASLYPQWSPDGTKVLIYEADPGSNARMETVDMTGARTLIAGPSASLYAASYGRFTRDGSWIYFTGVGTSTSGFTTYRIRPDGAQLEAVGPSPAEGGSLRPDISPDGMTEIFQFANGGIGSMDIATHAIKTLATSGSFPRYSPDGREIAYLAGPTYSLQIFVMNADGTNPRQVSPGTATYQELSDIDWSPEGQWIIASPYYSGVLELVHVSDGVRVPLRMSGFQAAFKP